MIGSSSSGDNGHNSYSPIYDGDERVADPLASIPIGRLRSLVTAAPEEEEEGELCETPQQSLPQRPKYAKAKEQQRQQESVSSSAFESESGTYCHREREDDDGDSYLSKTYNRDNYPHVAADLIVQWPPSGIKSREKRDVPAWYEIYARRARGHLSVTPWDIYDVLVLRE